MTQLGTDDNLRRQMLDLLRFPLAVVVLAVHVWSLNAPVIGGQALDLTEFPVLTAINHVIDGFLRGQSTPIYFFISGYVFFFGVELTRETYERKLRNRIRTLLVPYIIWNAIALLVAVGLHVLPSLAPSLSGYMAGGEPMLNITFKGVLSCFWNYDHSLFGASAVENAGFGLSPINAPLWFVEVLMLLVIITPLIYKALRVGGGYLVAVLGLLWFVIDSCDSAGSFLTAGERLSVGLFFFSWGACMSMGGRDMLAVFGRFFGVSTIGYLLFGLLYVAAAYMLPNACGVIKNMNIVVGLLFACNVSAWLLKSGRCVPHPLLSASSFFIYVSHIIVAPRIVRLLFGMLHPSSDAMLVAVYVLATVLSVFLLLGVFAAMRRLTPGLLRVVAGRK